MTNQKEIVLIKNDCNDRTDMDWLEEFYEFLQGTLPEGMSFGRGQQPKMSAKKAWSVIWYLQEHLSVFPDNIEKCDVCELLYDSHSEGCFVEKQFKHYCGSCIGYAPDDID